MALIQKAFSDIITFSRSSNATRVGTTGLVEYAPHNLLLQSQDFSTTWANARSSEQTNVTTAPDGTVTADKLIEDTTAADTHFIGQALSKATEAVTYTASIFAKYAGRNLRLLIDPSASGNASGASGANIDVNLQTGTIINAAGTFGSGWTGVSGSITSVGNGWYRVVLTVTSNTAANISVKAYCLDASNSSVYTGDGTSGIYIWGAQLSVGPYALDYTPTTSAAVYGPRFDYDGSGVTIVEPVSTNLLTYSEQFDNAAWTKYGSSVTANAVASPDGTVTADKLVEDTGNNTHQAAQSSVAAGTYTASVYAKAGERTKLEIATIPMDIGFDLSLGTILYGSGGSITSVGNGWYRCTITFTQAVSGNAIFRILNSAGNRSYTGDGTSGIYLWGAQLEIGNTATGYMVSGATNGFRAVPVVSGSATARGLLVEEQRTNLALYSEDLSNAAWAKTRSSITANAIAAPDGTVTADKLVEDTTASNTHFIVQAIAMGGSVDSSRFAFGIFAKAGERSRIRMFDNNQSSSGDSTFNLSAGTVVTGSGTITNVGNGWYRCTIYPLKDFSTTSTVRIEIDNGSTTSYTGDGTSGLYLWGAQLEAGSFATSYIPTVASTVTRSADVASVNTLSPWFNATEGSFYIEANTLATSTGWFSLIQPQANTLPSDERLSLGITSSNANSLYALDNGSVVVNGITSGGSIFANRAVAKTAFRYKVNDYAISGNGAAIQTDTSATVPTIDKVLLGDDDQSRKLNGYLRRVSYYPRALSDAELQALTA